MDKNELLNTDFPNLDIITDEMATATLRHRTRLRNSVRLSTGRLLTTHLINDRRERVNNYRHSK